MTHRFALLALLLLSLGSGPAAAKEKIRLMYLETDHEVRTAVLIGRLDLPLEVYRVGIFRVGPYLYGYLRLAATQAPNQVADQHRIASTAALLSDRIFGEIPELTRIDFEGVSGRETKEHKPEVFFSATVDRSRWKTIPKTALPLVRIQSVGAIYFAPQIAVGQPLPTPPPKPVKAKKPQKTPPAKASKASKTRDKATKRESVAP